MASVQHTPELWITYHQASRAQKPVTAQLIEVGDGVHIFDLEDVLDHVFQQGFVDPNWRSVVWVEDRDSKRLKTSHTVKDLLVNGAGNTPETALRLVISDIPVAIWVHYEYLHDRHSHTSVQRIRLDLPDNKFERLAHLTNHIFAKGYLPNKVRSAVSWKSASGKHIEENARVDDVLSLGEGVSEDKPLRLVIGRST
ncbi:hypothetical protein H4582DRAFT_2072453 [Lactarius indigo]|nr:hypothetical protein H4582DRAFT_2088548 [Lactarius indigo]KAI9443404.1 hypothetical protein H4582DRAFT_2072453 [Lactarius indigo]